MIPLKERLSFAEGEVEAHQRDVVFYRDKLQAATDKLTKAIQSRDELKRGEG